MNDPNQALPYQATQMISINYAPIVGQISITPSSGTALITTFTITLSNFVDVD
jgi:hypothetical protein